MTYRSPANRLLQRKCACGGTPGPSGECAECRKKKRLDLQRKAGGESGLSQVPAIVHNVLRSPGRSLAAKTRNEMESRFGHDFSQVRIHTDARAAESARAVDALAYTVGRQVVFGAGQYRPSEPQGQRLLAHELTHVVQQSASGRSSSNRLRIGPEDDRHEREADRLAARVTGDLPASAGPLLSAPRLQRTMICARPIPGTTANHAYIDDTGSDDCRAPNQANNYALHETPGSKVRGCALKTDHSVDPEGRTPVGKPCRPKSSVTDLSACLRQAYDRYADPSFYSNVAVVAGAIGGGVVGGAALGIGGALLGGLVSPALGIVGLIAGGLLGFGLGAVAGARVAGGANGPNSNTFAATLAGACCEDASSSGLGFVPGWRHAPATPCPNTGQGSAAQVQTLPGQTSAGEGAARTDEERRAA